MQNSIIVVIIIIVILVLWLNFSSIESFRSNCMENVFGQISCYPYGMFPFFIADYVFPRFPHTWSPRFHGPSYRPLIRRPRVVRSPIFRGSRVVRSPSVRGPRVVGRW